MPTADSQAGLLDSRAGRAETSELLARKRLVEFIRHREMAEHALELQTR